MDNSVTKSQIYQEPLVHIFQALINHIRAIWEKWNAKSTMDSMSAPGIWSEHACRSVKCLWLFQCVSLSLRSGASWHGCDYQILKVDDLNDVYAIDNMEDVVDNWELGLRFGAKQVDQYSVCKSWASVTAWIFLGSNSITLSTSSCCMGLYAYGSTLYVASSWRSMPLILSSCGWSW